MTEKITLLIILYTAFLIVDLPILKKQQMRERMYYMIAMFITFYLALCYLLDTKWPNLNSLLDLIFGNTAKQIVAFFKDSG